MEYRDIGENIRKYRNRLNLTQDQLADKIGVTWEMVSRYERGQSSPINKLDKISDALGISLRDLMSEDISESYEVPLFIREPKGMVFKKESTTLYYSCPKWLFKIDPEVFVIDLNIIKEGKYKYGETGYLFISPHSQIDDNDLVLTIQKDVLSIREFQYQKQKILGKVMLEEIIF
jgi:transcriptional regulator with XRE-family HTH domain